MIPMNFMKSKAGFTLVELIVVIAILGILAGIAVPAYGGYIRKANSAADTQVQSAVNTAIAAACTENNVAMEDADLYLIATESAVGAKGGCTITFTASTVEAYKDTATKILGDFTIYNSGATATFKYYVDAVVGADGNLVMTEPAS